MIPEGWETKRLADVVEIQRGFDLPHHARRPGPYPVLTSGETGGFHDEGPIKGPGMIVGRATNLGKPKWSDGDFWPHNTTMFVKDFKGNHPRWVFHTFENTDLAGYDSGSVQPMLNRNYIAAVPVLVPPVVEQQAIAEVLGALDDKIAANTKLVERAEDFARTLLVPFEPTVPLAEVVQHRKQSVNPLLLASFEVAHFSLPAFDSRRMPELVNPSDIKSSKFLIEQPSVLVSKLNPRFPRMWDVPETPSVPALASTEFLVLEPVRSTTTFLWACLSQPTFGEALEAKVAGTSGSHQRVRPADLLDTKVIDPAEVTQGVKLQVTETGLIAQHARTENVTLAATRDTLLPRLMSGKLRVRDAEVAVGSLV